MADAVQPQTRKWPPLFHSPNNKLKLAIWGTMNEPASLSNSISLLRTKQGTPQQKPSSFACEHSLTSSRRSLHQSRADLGL